LSTICGAGNGFALAIPLAMPYFSGVEKDNFNAFLQSTVWMADPLWALGQYMNYRTDIQLLQNGASLKDMLLKYRMAPSEPTYLDRSGAPSQNVGGIAHIYLSGVMTEEGQAGMCSRGRGIVDMIEDLEQLDANSTVEGVLLEINSGGGSAIAAHMLTEAIKQFSKPIVTYGHFVGSAAYMAAAVTDEIVAAGNGAQFGSIGTLIQVSNEALKTLQENYTTLYSTLSTQKNKKVRGLLAGDSGPILEHLDNLAKNFIGEVKGARNISNKEVFEGDMYLAKDSKKFGLIDNIGGKNKAVRILNRHIKLSK